MPTLGVYSIRCATLVFALSSAGTDAGATDATAESQAEIMRLGLAGHKDSRERLRNGMFRASGRRQYVSLRHGLNTDVEVGIFCAFDYDAGLVRFDREEPPYNPKNDPNNYGGQFARTPAQVLLRPPHGHSVTIRPPETPPLVGVNPIDIRTAGSANLAEMERGFSFAMIFGSVEGFLREDRLVEVVSESDRIVRITWRFEESGAQRIIWFDRGAGHSPIRLEDREPLAGGEGFAEPMYTCDVSWAEAGGTWVPTALAAVERLGMTQAPDSPRQIRRYDLQFTWERVNEGIPDDLFTADGFYMEDGSAVETVLDARLPTPVVVKAPIDRPRREEPVRAQGGWLRTALLAVNVLVLVGMILYWLARSRRAQS